MWMPAELQAPSWSVAFLELDVGPDRFYVVVLLEYQANLTEVLEFFSRVQIKQ
jgi:hypothetical protein